MREYLPFAAAFAGGLLLGGVFFGGLWLTVKFAIHSSRLPFWFFISFLARMSVSLGGFYLAAQGGWEPLLTCLVGFIVARVIVLRLTRPMAMITVQEAEPTHAT